MVQNYKEYKFSASDIANILMKKYSYKESFDNSICFFIFGSSKSTNLLSKTDNINYDTLKRLSNNINTFINSKKCKHLFAIYNNNNHWSLIYMSKMSKYYIVYFFDSLNIHNTNDILEIIHGIFKDNNKNILVYKNNNKIQYDSFNCGVYVIMVLIKIIKTPPKVLSNNPFKHINEQDYQSEMLMYKKDCLKFLCSN